MHVEKARDATAGRISVVGNSCMHRLNHTLQYSVLYCPLHSESSDFNNAHWAGVGIVLRYVKTLGRTTVSINR